MRRATGRIAAISVAASLLAACGGGGGGDGGGGGNNPPDPRLTVNTTTVSVSAQSDEQQAPYFEVGLSVENLPEEGLWIAYNYTTNGIEFVNFVPPQTGSEATLYVQFRLPVTIPDGRFEDTLRVSVCVDEACTDNISGSPVTIRLTYDVASASVTLDRDHVESEVDARAPTTHRDTLHLTLDRPLENGPFYQVTNTNRAIAGVYPNAVSATQAEVYIDYTLGSLLEIGSYDDVITLKACFDYECSKQLVGSPFQITSRHEVTIYPEPGYESLEVASRVALGHDVIDAEFSRALNKVVMVSGEPANALYVYDVTTGTEKRQRLQYEPHAVSIAPDGLSAAVGHSSRLSVVDLTQVGDAGAPAPVVLDIDTPVFDLVLDGFGKVHVAPSQLGSEPMRTVDVATNTIAFGSRIGMMTRIRLHPSGTAFYEAHTIGTPTNVAKWDISSGTATYLYDSSQYHGTYEVCGNAWFDPAGSLVYTACGNVFTSNTVQADDLIYAGALEITNTASQGLYSHVIHSLTENAATNEIALVDGPRFCGTGLHSGPCYTHLALYDAAAHTRQATLAINPVDVDDVVHAQIGHHVFHDSVNGRKYLISQLERLPPEEAFYLSVIE